MMGQLPSKMMEDLDDLEIRDVHIRLVVHLSISGITLLNFLCNKR